MRALSKKRARAGFTLVELMVALVMGLIIAIAAVGLARTATTTFHEQARVSGMEMSIRSASERLRSDLLKASYMSTPNIHLDPRVARVPGTTVYRIDELKDLQGIYIDVGAGTAATQGAFTLATVHGLTPDDLYIAGNLTTDDSYRGQWIGAGSCGAGSAQLRLNGLADAAVGRLLSNASTAVLGAQAAFMPGENMNPPVTGKEYVVQVMDPRGCYQYMTVCKVSNGATANEVLLDLKGDPAYGILTPTELLGGLCGGRLMEEFSLAPVSRVRWYLAANTDARLTDPTYDGTGGANKFNLYRQLLAASVDFSNPTAAGSVVGPPELIAEYAVDMKFGLVVDDVLQAQPKDRIVNLDMDSSSAAISTWARRVNGTVLGQPGAQRIKSVRYRLAFRAPIPDRQTNLPMATGHPFLARYCTNSNDLATCKSWSRVRTIMSEVALINQAKIPLNPANNLPF